MEQTDLGQTFPSPVTDQWKSRQPVQQVSGLLQGFRPLDDAWPVLESNQGASLYRQTSPLVSIK